MFYRYIFIRFYLKFLGNLWLNLIGNCEEIERSYYSVGYIKIVEEFLFIFWDIFFIFEGIGVLRFWDCCGKIKDLRDCERNDVMDGIIFF